MDTRKRKELLATAEKLRSRALAGTVEVVAPGHLDKGAECPVQINVRGELRRLALEVRYDMVDEWNEDVIYVLTKEDAVGFKHYDFLYVFE